MTAQPILDLEPLPRLEGGEIDLAAMRRILRMHVLQPAGFDFLIQRAAGELQPALVEEFAALVVIQDPKQHGGGVGHAAKAVLALAQTPLDAPSLLR